MKSLAKFPFGMHGKGFIKNNLNDQDQKLQSDRAISQYEFSSKQNNI